jgi:hypothetical protein
MNTAKNGALLAVDLERTLDLVNDVREVTRLERRVGSRGLGAEGLVGAQLCRQQDTYLPCCTVSFCHCAPKTHHGITLPDHNVVRLLDGVNVAGKVLVDLNS